MCKHFPKPVFAPDLLKIAQRKLYEQLRIKLRGEDIFHFLIERTENSHVNGLDAGRDEELRPFVQSTHHRREVLIKEKILKFWMILLFLSLQSKPSQKI